LIVFDPAANTWTAIAAMPTARNTLGAAVLNGKLYTYGGSVPANYTAIVEAYDPATDSWSVQSSMLSPRTELAAAASGGKLYAIGGINTTGNLASTETLSLSSGLVAWYPGEGNANDIIGNVTGPTNGSA